MSRIIKMAVLAFAFAASGCSSILQQLTPAAAVPERPVQPPRQQQPATPQQPVTPSQPAPVVRPSPVITVAAPKPAAKAPEGYSSMQPFKKFQKGEGKGVAYQYKSRTKQELIAILRDTKLAAKEMRVPCEVIVRQMAEANPDLPFESCEGTAKALESNEYVAVPCQKDMFMSDTWLTVTDAKGSSWGVWHRACLPGEMVLVYRGRPLISLMCFNTTFPTTISAPTPALLPQATPQFVTGTCPRGYTLIVYAWSLADFTPELYAQAKQLINEANARDSEEATKLPAYQGSSFSRLMGGPLRRSWIPTANVSDTVWVRFLDTQSGNVRFEVGAIELKRGAAGIRFTTDPRQYVTELEFEDEYVSPTMSGGEHRLRIFPNEWVTCTVFAHGAVW